MTNKMILNRIQQYIDPILRSNQNGVELEDRQHPIWWLSEDYWKVLKVTTSCNVELTDKMKRIHSCPPNTSPITLFPNSTTSLQSSNTPSTLNSYSSFASLPTLSSPISNSLPVINSFSHYISHVSSPIPQSD